MPTYTNPTSDASDAYEALRGLAHASRSFEDPSETYVVIGELLGGLRSLRQVLDQLAAAHLVSSITSPTSPASTAAVRPRRWPQRMSCTRPARSSTRPTTA